MQGKSLVVVGRLSLFDSLRDEGREVLLCREPAHGHTIWR
ncbi:hypothetical protein Pla175_23920 [Pirellulimonas nuda]|uniref:Uncharacterized protein n=1 Tax=Pirellulimonas nuda TaxID=2528009 RepID=A0A518DBZ3_9BACT|nr:hypothetical protein Pla175_23920 [Pirellulimonas nuda]